MFSNYIGPREVASQVLADKHMSNAGRYAHWSKVAQNLSDSLTVSTHEGLPLYQLYSFPRPHILLHMSVKMSQGNSSQI